MKTITQNRKKNEIHVEPKMPTPHSVDLGEVRPSGTTRKSAIGTG